MALGDNMAHLVSLMYLICLVSLIAVVGAEPTINDTVRWQLHSYNDLREWPQLFGKFVRGDQRYFKADPNFQNASFCESLHQNSHAGRGCLLLNHNPITTVRPYNNTQDLLDIVSDPRFRFFFASAEIPVAIALCFKIDFDPCKGSKSALNWLSLVDEFFANATRTIAQNGLNLQFILDGAGTPHYPCLAQRWRPWNTTYIQPSDPVQGFTSNDPSQGLDRMSVLDDSVPPMIEAALARWGKFVNVSEYPLLVWEPSDEATIAGVADLYVRIGITHRAGFRFAINIDPAMFDIYAASITGKAAHTRVDAQASSPFLVSLPSPSPDFSAVTSSVTTVLIVFESKGILWYRTQPLTSLPGPPPSFTSSPFPLPGSEVFLDAGFSSLSCSCVSLPCTVLATANDGTFVLYSVSVSDPAGMKPTMQSSFPFPPLDSDMLTAAALLQPLVAVSVQASAQILAADCVALVTVWSLDDMQAYSNSVCLVFNTESGSSLPLSSSVTSVAVSSVLLSSSQGVERECFAEPHSSMQVAGVVVVLSSADNTTSAAMLCVDLLSGRMVSALNNSSATSASGMEQVLLAQIGVGTHPSVSTFVTDSNQLVVLEAHSDGYCDNCEDHNKRTEQSVCDSVPVSTPLVLNYNYGTWSAWKNLLETSIFVTGEFAFSSCSVASNFQGSYFFHGAYDQGSNPSVSLFADPVAGVSVAEMHNGFPSDAADAGSCGAPIAFDGTMFDRWPLPQFVQWDASSKSIESIIQ